MNSVRPFVTITILVVVGAYLYVKINEGPARPPGPSEVWQNETPGDVPPLDSAVGMQPSVGNAAPSWPPTSPTTTATLTGENFAVPVSPIVATTAVDAVANPGPAPPTLPAVPAIPSLPDMSTPANMTGSPATTSIPLPVDLPANVPTAHYPDQQAAPTSPTAAISMSEAPPLSQNAIPSVIPPSSAGETASDTALPYPTTSPQSPLAQNPLRNAGPPVSEADQYSSIYGHSQPAEQASFPTEATFAASWPEIQAALAQGELAKAHTLLSKWHDDPSLIPADAEQVESLLGQLAGSVIYSTAHQLQPARLVKPGETLESIASEYHVPWQLLAKINGFSAPDQVQPGQQLKVVPGPFSADIDMQRNRLTLMVDGRYAGKFAVSVPAGTELPAGEWVVLEKQFSPMEQQPLYGAAQAVPKRSLILRNAEATASNPGMPLVVGSGPIRLNSGVQTNGAQFAQPTVAPLIELSAADAEEISDILSVGSRVVIRR